MKYLIEHKNKSGIYKITNSINLKIYVGSAINLYKRFIGHKNQFITNKHNDRFQNFMNKYGIDTLSFCLIEYCDKDMLIEREQYWIDYYQSYKSKLGYNVSKTAGSTLGCKMPKSHIESCIKRMKGNKFRLNIKWTEAQKKDIGERSKQFWLNNPDKKQNMANKISTKKKGKPQWVDKPHPMLGKFGEDNPNYGKKRSEEFKQKVKNRMLKNNPMKGKELSNSHKNKIREKTGTKVFLLDKNNEVIDIFKSTRDAAIKLNIDYSAISKNCRGLISHVKGYNFIYAYGMCSCGEINKELKLSDRVWTCKSCGVTHNRDELAANNIKKFAFINIKNTAGIVGINACGDEAVALSGKQEAYSPLGKG